MHVHPQFEWRFFAKIVRAATGCWEWIGATCGTGTLKYGQITYKGKKTKPHRIAYRLYCGDIPPGMFVCHHCDNPLCCRPDHLFLGTPADNSADCVAKGRTAAGEKNGFTKLKDSQVSQIRARYAAGGVLQRELAKEFGVSYYQINRILNFKSRRRIP